MGKVRRATMSWTGENLDLHATLGTGPQFGMSSPLHGGDGGNGLGHIGDSIGNFAFNH